MNHDDKVGLAVLALAILAGALALAGWI